MAIVSTQKQGLRVPPVALALRKLEAKSNRSGKQVAMANHFPRSENYTKRDDGCVFDFSANLANPFVLSRGRPLDPDKGALFKCILLTGIRVNTNSGHVRSGNTQVLE